MLFPLGELRRQDVLPEKVENPVTLHGLGKFQARTEDGLQDIHLTISITVGGHRSATIEPENPH